MFLNKKTNFKGWDFIDKVSRLVKRNMKDLGYEEEERDWVEDEAKEDDEGGDGGVVDLEVSQVPIHARSGVGEGDWERERADVKEV